MRDDFSGEVNGVAMSNTLFVTVMKGYAVIFSFTGEDQKSIEEMTQVMNTVLPVGMGGGDRTVPTSKRKPE